MTYLRELARGERREVLPITVALPVGTVVRPVAEDSVLLELPHHQNLRIIDGHNRISMLIERHPDMQFVAVIPYAEPTLCDHPPSTPIQVTWQVHENECYRLFDAVAPTEPIQS